MKMDLLSSVKRKKIIIIVSICLASLLVVGGIILGIVLANANKIKLTFKSDSYTTIVSLDGKELPTKIKNGKEVTFKVIVEQGYVVNEVLVDNVPQNLTSDNTYTIKIETKNESVGIFSNGRVAGLSGLSFTGELEQKVQYDGEIFNPSGLTFNRVFEDGTTKDLPNSFLTFPKLVYGEPVTLSYNQQTITVPGLEIKYSVVFDLGNYAKFENTQLSTLKIGYDGNKDSLSSQYPTEQQIVIANGSKIGALKGWNLVSDEQEKNLVFEPIWNYLDNFTAEIVIENNKPILKISSTVLVCEGFELLKVKLGNLEKKCEIAGNTLTASFDLSELEAVTSGDISGSQILISINEDTTIAVPSYVDLSTTSHSGFTYEITKSSEGKIVIKKIIECDYEIEYSKLEFVDNKLNITLQVFDYITQTKQNLHQGTNAKILIGDYYKLNAVLSEDLYTISAIFNLDNFNITNLFELNKEYQFKIELEYNGLKEILEIPVGITDIDSFIEYNEHYYNLTKSTDSTKIYISYAQVLNPEFTVDEALISKSADNYILTVNGTANYVNTIRIIAKYNNIEDPGLELTNIESTYSCLFNLSQLQTTDSPIYDLYVRVNDDKNYDQRIKASVYDGELQFETNLVNNEKNIYKIIKNLENDTLHIQAEKEVITATFSITQTTIINESQNSDYKLQVVGTCQNITDLYLVCDNVKGGSATIQDNQFILTYSLSNLTADGNNKTFTIAVNQDENNFKYLDFTNSNLENTYSFINQEGTITKYSIKNISDLLIIVKTIEDIVNINQDIAIDNMDINDDLILTIYGRCVNQNVTSIYLVCKNVDNQSTINGDEGINVHVDPLNFVCTFDLKLLEFTQTTTYSFYFSINSSIQQQVENNFLLNKTYQYDKGNSTYKFLFKDSNEDID